MLEVRDLSVSYGQHRALEQAGLHVGRGEIVVILGANGAGKSTLLKAISGICEGEVHGSVMLAGVEMAGLPANRIVDEGIALVPEGRGVFSDLTVHENLVLGAYSGRARDDEAANLARVFSLFPKLYERRRQIVRTMSGGEQQMVAIGRAMMSSPTILTLDEPSLGLSPLLCKELFENLKAVRDLGIGILLVEQNARQSLAIADRGYLLENAHIVHEDSADALIHDQAVQAAYLGAGGAAAPHTYDDIEETVPAELPAAQTPAFTIRPRSTATQSADALLGASVADLVERATSRHAETVAVRDNRTTATDPTTHGDRLAATIAEIERAAAAARHARTIHRERPLRKPDAAPNRNGSAETAGPIEPAVTIEVYRAPRVEVYRRRPGGDDFDRT